MQSPARCVVGRAAIHVRVCSLPRRLLKRWLYLLYSKPSSVEHRDRVMRDGEAAFAACTCDCAVMLRASLQVSVPLPPPLPPLSPAPTSASSSLSLSSPPETSRPLRHREQTARAKSMSKMSTTITASAFRDSFPLNSMLEQVRKREADRETERDRILTGVTQAAAVVGSPESNPRRGGAADEFQTPPFPAGNVTPRGFSAASRFAASPRGKCAAANARRDKIVLVFIILSLSLSPLLPPSLPPSLFSPCRASLGARHVQKTPARSLLLLLSRSSRAP